MRPYLIAVVLLTLLLGSIAAIRYGQIQQMSVDEQASPPVVVAATIATLESWDRFVDSVGTLRAVRGIELTSEASGEVAAVHFDSGDRVEAGQLMVVLDDSVERASREDKRAALELARQLHARDVQLLAQKSISQTEFDRSLAELEQTRAQLAEAEAQLEKKQIKAPFAGVTGIRHIELGDYVSPGTVITSLQDLSRLEIDFTVTAQTAPLLRSGQAVEVRVDAFPDDVFTAVVLAVDSRVDTGTQNIAARAGLDGSTPLVPGMFAALRVRLGVPQQLVTVPETAVSYSLHGDTVHVIREAEDGGLTQESVVVELGSVRDGRIVILSGIDAGDRVVVAGQNKLFRGARVAVDESVAW